MANSNESFEGEKTSQLTQITLGSARENHYEGVFSIEGHSKRMDTAEIAGTTDIAPEFSSLSSYSKGVLVYHSGVLYRAKANIAAGTWNASNWETAKIGQIMASKDDVTAALGNIETLLAAI